MLDSVEVKISCPTKRCPKYYLFNAKFETCCEFTILKIKANTITEKNDIRLKKYLKNVYCILLIFTVEK